MFTGKELTRRHSQLYVDLLADEGVTLSADYHPDSFVSESSN
jgi:hypothetical protein